MAGQQGIVLEPLLGVVEEIEIIKIIGRIGTSAPAFMIGHGRGEFHPRIPAAFALLGHHVDHAGLGIAVLGAESAGVDLHLLQRGDDGQEGALVAERVDDGRTADEVGRFAHAAAAEMVVDHIGLQFEDVGDARHTGDADHFTDIIGQLGGREVLLDLVGPVGGDDHLLPRQGGGLQRDIETGGLVDFNLDLLVQLLDIADVGDPDVVIAGGKIEDKKLALQVGDRPRRPAQGGSPVTLPHGGNHHIGAEQRLAALAVCHRAGDLARLPGGEGGRHGACQQERKKGNRGFDSMEHQGPPYQAINFPGTGYGYQSAAISSG